MDALQACEAARLLWERSQPQLFFELWPDAQVSVTSHAESEGGRPMGVARDQDRSPLGSRANEIVAMRSGGLTSLAMKKSSLRPCSRDDLSRRCEGEGYFSAAGSNPASTGNRRVAQLVEQETTPPPSSVLGATNTGKG